MTDHSSAAQAPSLLPCEHCGSDRFDIDEFSGKPEAWEWRVLCLNKDCQAWGPEKPTRDDAIAAWNARQSLASAAGGGDQVGEETLNWSEAHDFAERYDLPESVVPYLAHPTTPEKAKKRGDLQSAIRAAKTTAVAKHGIDWRHLEEISKFELVFDALDQFGGS